MRHLGPAEITIYIDGYTVAAGTACGLNLSSEENLRPFVEAVTIHPDEVGCDACRATAMFRDHAASYEAATIAAPPAVVHHVPHMRSWISRRGGAFDRAANDALADHLSIHIDYPSRDEHADIARAEQEKQLRYARRRIERLEEHLAEARSDLEKLIARFTRT